MMGPSFRCLLYQGASIDRTASPGLESHTLRDQEFEPPPTFGTAVSKEPPEEQEPTKSANHDNCGQWYCTIAT